MRQSVEELLSIIMLAREKHVLRGNNAVIDRPQLTGLRRASPGFCDSGADLGKLYAGPVSIDCGQLIDSNREQLIST